MVRAVIWEMAPVRRVLLLGRKVRKRLPLFSRSMVPSRPMRAGPGSSPAGRTVISAPPPPVKVTPSLPVERRITSSVTL